MIRQLSQYLLAVAVILIALASILERCSCLHRSSTCARFEWGGPDGPPPD